MITEFLSQLATMKWVQDSMAFFNRFPIPYQRLPVRVGDVQMKAHTLDRYLALWLWKWQQTGEQENNYLTQICQPGFMAVDIGANIGYYSLLLAHYVGQTGHVWAFEPDQNNFATLQDNVHLNQATNITVINAAVGQETREEQLFVSAMHQGDHRIYQPQDMHNRTAVPIKMIALDDFFTPEQNIDMIKMDIQGAEGYALAGMQRILSDNRQLVLLMEFWPMGLTEAGFDPRQILLDLQLSGFSLARFDEKETNIEPITDIAHFVQSIPDKHFTSIVARRN